MDNVEINNHFPAVKVITLFYLFIEKKSVFSISIAHDLRMHSMSFHVRKM